ncbi:MAG: hypothetical protein LLF86_05190 [Nitrospiraceae bacterium]|nr:hypothetical protein [Nitrospiraceae bacterium]
MATQIAVSFEEKGVRIVYASTGSRNLKLQKALLISDEEFDDFLHKESAGRFTVSADFKAIFHDIIQLPPVPDKFIKKLVSNEIKKRSPELGEFLFSHEVIGDRFVEGRKVREVFALAVSQNEVNSIISRFSSRGRTVDAVYPNISCISAFASEAMGRAEDTALFVSESGFAKTLFVMDRGKLVFVRKASSTGSGMRDFDVQNVNMTISYCRQTLKLNPSVVMMAGSSCHEYEASGETIVPSACMMLPANVRGRQDVVLDNIFPVSALLLSKKLKSSNMLPVRYRAEQMLNTFFKAGAACFVVLSAAGLISLRNSSDKIQAHEQRIKTLSMQVAAAAPAAAEIKKLQARLQPLMPAVNAFNSSNSAPDAKKALASASGLSAKGVSVESIRFGFEAGSVRVTAKGSIKSDSYLRTQALFAEVLDSLGRSGLQTVSKKLDLKDNTFNLEAAQKVAK